MYAVLFDIDGTLLQTGGAGRLAFAETFSEEFDLDDLTSKVPFAGRSDRAIAEDLMRLGGIEVSQKNWQRFLTCYCQRILDTLTRTTGGVLPGIAELLDSLAQLEDVAVGLLTGNVRQGAQAKLAYYGLANWFAFGGFGDELTDRNEIAASAVRAATEYIEESGTGRPLDLNGVMVIGDTKNDVECAQSIGAVAVAVATGGASLEELSLSKPDFAYPDLTDTTDLLAMITDASRNGSRSAAAHG